MAVRRAGGAFNDGEMEVSKEFAKFALAVCAKIKRSLSWIKLACKWRMGLGPWRALQPGAAWIRREPLTNNKFQ